MRIVVFSDVHGKDLSTLESRVLDALGPEDLILCLGDLDTPETLKNVKRLQDKYNQEEDRMNVLPGNHEFALVHKEPVITFTDSREITTIIREFALYVKRLHNDPIALEFAKRLIRNPWTILFLDEPRYGNAYHTLAIHGALDGDLNSDAKVAEFEPQSQEARLWYRLRSREGHARNFAVMKKSGLRLMIRGHDKEPEFAYRDTQGRVFSLRGTGAHVLLPDRLHTVTVGPYRNGYYTVIDTNFHGYTSPIVSLRRL